LDARERAWVEDVGWVSDGYYPCTRVNSTGNDAWMVYGAIEKDTVGCRYSGVGNPSAAKLGVQYLAEMVSDRCEVSQHWCRVRYETDVSNLTEIDEACTMKRWGSPPLHRFQVLDKVARTIGDKILAGLVTKGMPLQWYEMSTNRTQLVAVRLSDGGIIEKRVQQLSKECQTEFRDGLLEHWHLNE